MKKLSLLFAVLAISIGAMAQSVQVGPYTVDVIIKNVYHIQDGNDSNPPGNSMVDGKMKNNNCSDMYLIVGSKKSLLIDLSNFVTWDATAVESLRSIVYDRIGKTDFYITITHNHGDHLGMLPAFKDDEKAKFWIPVADFADLSRFPAGRTTTFKEGESFDAGGLVVNTLTVQGHTVGSTVFFLKDKNIAFSGDAVGSGSGVWIFSNDGYRQYVEGVNKFVAYIKDKANKIDTEKFIIYGGHFWQKEGHLDNLDAQYVFDMQTLNQKIAEGTAETSPMTGGRGAMNTYFKYGTATICWSDEGAKEYSKEYLSRK